MKNYIELGKKILEEGHIENTRIGATLALHNQVLSYDLTRGFPLMTSKHVGQKSIVHETLWYLSGTTNVKYLEDNKVMVWSKFADENGEIGKTYAYQFRNFNGVDQVEEVIKMLNDNTQTNRRAIINLYNVGDLDEMSIPPCIAMIQFNTYFKHGYKFLDTTIMQRSADFCLGVPYDIAEMALLAHIIAAYTDSTPKDITFFYSNIHVYTAHIRELEKQLKNKHLPLPEVYLDKEAITKVRPEEIEFDWIKFIGVKKRPKYSYELF